MNTYRTRHRLVCNLLNTTSVDHDYRVQKMLKSQLDFGLSVSLFALENDNEDKSYKRSGVDVFITSLRSRSWFQQARGLWLKTIELYIKGIVHILKKRPDVIWFNDEDFMFLIPILRSLKWRTPIVWDMHELPSHFWRSTFVGRLMLRTASSVCTQIICTNEFRAKLVVRAIGERNQSKIQCVENYPDESFVNLPRGSLPTDIQAFLNGRKYFLFQGSAREDRAFLECVKACSYFPNYCLIVLGPISKQMQNAASQTCPDYVSNCLHVTGFVNHNSLHNVIDHAMCSLIFYKMSDDNRIYCSPNRLFEALSRGIPVVCGHNPTIQEHLSEGKMGVLCETDGTDVQKIRSGIQLIIDNKHAFRPAPRAQKAWDSQRQIIGKILSACKLT